MYGCFPLLPQPSAALLHVLPVNQSIYPSIIHSIEARGCTFLPFSRKLLWQWLVKIGLDASFSTRHAGGAPYTPTHTHTHHRPSQGQVRHWWVNTSYIICGIYIYIYMVCVSYRARVPVLVCGALPRPLHPLTSVLCPVCPAARGGGGSTGVGLARRGRPVSQPPSFGS